MIKFPIKYTAPIVLFGVAMAALGVVTVVVALYSTLERIEGGGD